MIKKGFSLIEIIIAMFILITLYLVAYVNFSKRNDTLTNESKIYGDEIAINIIMIKSVKDKTGNEIRKELKHINNETIEVGTDGKKVNVTYIFKNQKYNLSINLMDFSYVLTDGGGNII